MNNRDAVIGLVFKAIQGIKKLGIPKYVYDEARLRDVNSWKLQERTADTFDAAMSEVRAMFSEDLETYPRKQSILSEYDPEGITEILESLIPRTLQMEQMGGEFPPANMEGPVQTETYYKAKFAVEVLPEETIKMWEDILAGSPDGSIEEFWSSSDEYKLPPANPYLVQDPDVGTIDAATPVFPALPQPKLVLEDDFGKLYVGEDKAFGDPYILTSIQIKTAGSLWEKYGPKARVMTNLFVDCLGEAIKDKRYPFEVAGLGASVSMGKGTNLYVSVSGSVPVKDTYMALLEVVLKPMKQDFEEYTSRDTFEMIRKAVMRYYRNKLKSGARETASRVLWNTFSKTRTPVDEKLQIAQNVTFEEVQSFIPELLQKINLEGFAYGRLTEQDATAVYKAVENTLRGGDATDSATAAATDTSSTIALNETEQFVSMMRVLPDTEGPWYLKSSGSARSNATVLLIDGGHLPCDEAMALPVLFKEVGNMFFRELRTKQQTGYVASAYATTVARRSVVMMVVESSWAGPGDLLKRFEEFIQMVLAGIDDGTVMPDAKLDSIRGSMLSSFDKPIQNIGGMAGILEGIIKEYDGDFDAEKKKQTILEGLTRAKIVKVAKQILGHQNKRRFAVLYSPSEVEHDCAPNAYEEFKNNTGTFEAKPKYQCNVCLKGVPCTTPAPAPPSEEPCNTTVVCGPGTVLQGSTCVPDSNQTASATTSTLDAAPESNQTASVNTSTLDATFSLLDSAVEMDVLEEQEY